MFIGSIDYLFSISLYVTYEIIMIGALAQQCPIDYPFAFDYGKGCCFFDRDNSDQPISTRSANCLYDTYRPCSGDRCLDNGITFCISSIQRSIFNIIIRYW